MLTFFIILQIILAFFLAFHDWLDLPPLTDIKALEKYHTKKERLLSSCINTILVLIPSLMTIQSRGHFSLRGIAFIVISYLLLTIGTICAWWIPYIFGSSQEHKQGFVEYKNTHTFLPARGDNVVPNTLHIIMHLFIWSCLGIAIYYLLSI